MVTQDYINGLFELVGSYFTWINAWTLYRDKEIKGVYWPATLFFSVWGVWNLYYYPSLHQWASFSAGIILVLGNIAWIFLLARYRRKQNYHSTSPIWLDKEWLLAKTNPKFKVVCECDHEMYQHSPLDYRCWMCDCKHFKLKKET